MATQFEALRRRTVQRLLLATAVLLTGLTLASGAQAQGPGGMNASPEDRATQRITLLTERVHINAQQAEQLKPILVKQFTEQTALFQKFQGGGDRAAMMGEMQTLRTKFDEQVTAVLTAEQKTAYAALREEELARRRGGGGGQ
jgi:periplasmic protein CpxP/Spy